MRIRLFVLLLATGLALGGTAYAAGTAETAAPDDVTTITMAGLYGTEVDDPLGLAIQERHSINIEWDQMSWDTWAEKTNLWFASGDMPDVVMWNFNAGAYRRLAGQGIFRAIPDLGSYPNLQRIYETTDAMQYLKVDGELYTWPRIKDVNHINEVRPLGIWARADWLEDLGYGNQDVFTPDEYRDMLIRMSDELGPELGASFVAYNGPNVYYPGWVFGLRWFNPHYDNYVEVDGEYVWGATLPSTIDGIKYARSLYEAEVVPEDFYAQPATYGPSQFTTGFAGALYEHWTLAQVDSRAKQLGENIDGSGHAALRPIWIAGPQGIYDAQDYEFWASIVFSPDTPDATFQKVLELFDWFVSEEGTLWSAYGIPGVDWTEEDGGIQVLWDTDEEGNYVSPGYQSMNLRQQVRNSTDIPVFNPAITEASHELFRHQVVRKAEAMDEYGANYIPVNYALDFFSAPNKDRFGAFREDVNDEIVRIIISGDDVEEAWTAFLNSMESRVQTVLDEINAGL